MKRRAIGLLLAMLLTAVLPMGCAGEKMQTISFR